MIFLLLIVAFILISFLPGLEHATTGVVVGVLLLVCLLFSIVKRAYEKRIFSKEAKFCIKIINQQELRGFLRAQTVKDLMRLKRHKQALAKRFGIPTDDASINRAYLRGRNEVGRAQARRLISRANNVCMFYLELRSLNLYSSSGDWAAAFACADKYGIPYEKLGQRPFEDVGNQQVLLKACDEARQSRWMRQKPSYVRKWCYSERQLQEEVAAMTMEGFRGRRGLHRRGRIHEKEASA